MTESKEKDTDKIGKNIISTELVQNLLKAANYCYNCNRCVNVCPKSLLGTFYPRNLVLDLTFLSPEEALKNSNIWECLTCGLCTIYCPMTKDDLGVNFTKIIRDLRSLASEYEPLQEERLKSQHYREYSNLPILMANDKIKIIDKLGFLEGTNLKISDKGEIAYFMGCLPFMTGIAPCANACPAGVDVQGYISLIADGKFQEAIDLIRETNPFPFLCGRICTEYCALNCNRQYIDDPIAIRVLKRFVSDWEIDNPNLSKIRPVEQTKEKVAIIGAGAAGLSAAYFLARMGYKPTVFEKSDKTGGMVRFGVPQYRISDKALDHDIEIIKSMGVEILTNRPFGPDLTVKDLNNDGFEAIYIATGLYVPKTLRLEGEDLPNVHVALDFLLDRKYRYWENKEEFKGQTVGILGGGAVAVDSAETALRLGAEKTHLIDILTEKDLELVLKDIHEHEISFIEYHFKTSTSKITKGKGNKLVLNCYKIEWGEPDKTGRKSLNKVEGSDFKIPVDTIVIAIGQGLDLEPINIATENKLKTERGKIVVDETTFETNIPGVFSGGDIIPNPRAVAIVAIAHGREAAISIDRYIRGVDLKEGRVNRDYLKRSPIPKKKIEISKQQKINLVPGEERISNFEEMELGFTDEQAIQEAKRCLNCSGCCSTDQILEDYNNSIDASGVMSCHYGKDSNLRFQNVIDYLEIPRAVLGILNQNDIVPVVLPNEKCCGHDLLWQGDIENFEKLVNYNVKLFKDAGVKTIIFSCAEGYYTWKYEYKKFFKDSDDFDFDIYHISEYILKEGLLDNFTFPNLDNVKVTYHDACRLGRLGGKLYDPPRELIKKIPGVELVEMKNIKDDAECCGVSTYLGF